MTLGSLFAGIDAFGHAFDGIAEVKWQVEIDTNCQKLLAAKWPNSIRLTDVRQAGRDNLPEVDIICAGWPCQNLSVAGRREGLKGDRSSLFFEAIRIINELQPAYVVCENVPGLLSSCSCEACGRRCANCETTAGIEDEECAVCGSTAFRGRVLPSHRGADLFAVVSSFVSLGYSGAWRICDCQYWGLAQRRARWFGVFSFGDSGAERASEILAFTEGLQGHPAPSREKGERVAPTVEGRLGRSGLGDFATSGGLAVNHVAPPVAGCSNHGGANGPGRTVDDCESLIILTANPIGGHHPRNDLDHETYVLAHGQANAEQVRDGEPSLTCNHEAPIAVCVPIQSVNTVREKKQNGIGIGEPGDEMFTLTGRDQHAIAFAFTERTRKYGRTFEAQELSYALTNPGSGGRTHSRSIASGTFVRRLTPLECLRLQGFPDDYFDGLDFSDSVKYRLIGNSIPIPVIRWIALRLAKVFNATTKNPTATINTKEPTQ